MLRFLLTGPRAPSWLKHFLPLPSFSSLCSPLGERKAGNRQWLELLVNGSQSFCHPWSTAEVFQIVVLQRILESPLDSKGIKPVHPKGSQPWIFIGRTDAETEAPILWLPGAKSQHIGKDSTHWKRPWGWERSRARRKEDDRAWDGWMASSTQWTRVWANWETVKDRDTQHASVHGVAKCQTGLSNWTTTKESNPVLCDNLEGWDGVRSGGRFKREGLTADSCWFKAETNTTL